MVSRHKRKRAISFDLDKVEGQMFDLDLHQKYLNDIIVLSPHGAL